MFSWSFRTNKGEAALAYAVKLERSTPLSLPRHPHSRDDISLAEWCAAERSTGKRLAIDLFSGAGGLGYGVESAGWSVVAAVDHDTRALETHRANFKGQALSIDMSDESEVDGLIAKLLPLGIDLVAGGPPCQPFSRAGSAKIRSLVEEGTRTPVDSRKDLWRSFVRVVLALLPRAVIMENVPDMAIGDDLKVIRLIADKLEQAGYAVDYRLLDAWKFGVPQHRKRFILQARRDGKQPDWPTPVEPRNVVRDAIFDLPRLGTSKGGRELQYSSSPQSDLSKALRGGDSGTIIYDHMTRPVRRDDLEAFELMTETTLYSDLPERLRRYRSDTFNDKYKRLGWDNLSRTITAHIAKDGYWYIHPEEHRTLTVREAARIQTFPDTFRFAGTRSDAFRQIGNAVPPMLGRAVAESTLHAENGTQRRAGAPQLRGRLTQWAEEQRRVHWWLFPGEHMTPFVAAMAAHLDVHRTAPSRAAQIMDPLKSAATPTLEVLSAIDVAWLSAAQRKTMKGLRQILRDDIQDPMLALINALTPSRRLLQSLLAGHDEIVLNEHVARVVRFIVGMNDGEGGLGTDIKVALARLVGTGESASLRMCAIRSISISEARSRIILTSEHDQTEPLTPAGMDSWL
ncbi:DNA cytosine methyltransferase [Herbiconiux sp. P18]|uniref:DNA cytosine methyltransferase n=1 Tax=Herbiconiux liangxiaofengii TaxID=3342795 RepID=UPI0035B7AB4C